MSVLSHEPNCYRREAQRRVVRVDKRVGITTQASERARGDSEIDPLGKPIGAGTSSGQTTLPT